MSKPTNMPAWVVGLLRYGVAVLSIVIALLLTHVLWSSVSPTPMIFFFIAVILSAWYGGFGPGVLGAFLAFFISNYYLIPPFRGLTFQMGDAVRLSVLMIIAMLVSSISAARRRADDALRRANNELEMRVQARTAELAQTNASLKAVEEESARLLGREQVARAEAEAAQRRLAFLAQASTVLASSLDYTTTLVSVANLAVPYFADWCTVDMLDEGGKIKRLAVAHVDPAKVEWAHELLLRYPPDPNAERGVPNVLRTGRPDVYREIPDELLVEVASDEEHLKVLREIGFKSVMIVPIIAGGRTLGAMTFVTTDTDRKYDAVDLALAEDLAQRASLAIENAMLYREAQEANRAKDEFLATVSHELRTPLNAILGWAHILRTSKVEDAVATRALETIERNAKSQAELIDDLLDISRIITGKPELKVRPVELPPVIEATIEAVRPAADARSIKIDAAINPSVGPILGDPNRLQQVLWNLLSNAIKFTPDGGRVEVRFDRADPGPEIGPYAQIVVSDTGKGISPEFLPYVFDRFRQADSTKTRRHGGLGLGLAIARHLVELHGGTVRAESPGADKGATFTVRLPLIDLETGPGKTREDPQRRNVIASEEGRAPAGAASASRPADSSISQSQGLSGLRVVVVEDEPDTLEMLCAVIRQYGAEVRSASTTAEALEIIAAWEADVLVSDIGLPGEDGYMLIKKLRARDADQGGNIPAIALTAYAGHEDKARAFAAGYQLHIAKPVEPDDLLSAIASLVEQAEKQTKQF